MSSMGENVGMKMGALRMNISFSGTRKINGNQNNNDVLRNIAHVVMGDAEIEKLFFGGAEGVDTVMLIRCGHLKSKIVSKKTLIVIVPDVVKEQPEIARNAIAEYADKVIELKNLITAEDGYKAYRLRNELLVKKCDRLYAFPLKKSHNRSGTWMTIRIAQKNNKDHKIIELEG